MKKRMRLPLRITFLKKYYYNKKIIRSQAIFRIRTMVTKYYNALYVHDRAPPICYFTHVPWLEISTLLGAFARAGQMWKYMLIS